MKQKNVIISLKNDDVVHLYKIIKIKFKEVGFYIKNKIWTTFFFKFYTKIMKAVIKKNVNFKSN